MKPLGRMIRDLRTQRGLSMLELAQIVGVSKSLIDDVENDRCNTDKLPEIARALGAPARTLLDLSCHVDRDLRNWLKINPRVIAFLRDVRAGQAKIDGIVIVD